MRSVAFVAAVLAVAAAGCGGGGDEGERLSAGEYRQKANAICTKANADLRALDVPDSLDGIDDFVNDAKPIVDDAVDDLDDLRPPEELESEHDRWVDQNRQMADTLDELKDASLAEIAVKAREFGRMNEEANETARDDLGLEDCGPDAA